MGLRSFCPKVSEVSGLRLEILGFEVYRAPKKHISKNRIGISHINPLIMKPIKVGISP